MKGKGCQGKVMYYGWGWYYTFIFERVYECIINDEHSTYNCAVLKIPIALSPEATCL